MSVAPRKPMWLSCAVLASALVFLSSAASFQAASVLPDQLWYTIDDRLPAGAFERVGGMAVAATGDLYAMDLAGHRILHYAPDGSLVGAWGSFGREEGRFDLGAQWTGFRGTGEEPMWDQQYVPAPLGLAVAPDGTVYVGDMGNRRVQRFRSDGTFIASWPVPDGAAPQGGGPVGLDIAADGTLYLSQTGTNDVIHMTATGQVLDRWSANGNCGTGTTLLQGIAVARDGSVYVADAGLSAACVKRYSAEGGFLGRWSPAVTGTSRWASLTGPIDVVAAPDDTVYVVVYGADHAVHHITADGQLLGTWGPASTPGDFTGLGAIAMDADGFLVIANPTDHAIQRYDLTGTLHSEIPTPIRSAYGQFAQPAGMATGPDGTIYVADSGNGRVQRFTPDGVFLAQYPSSGPGSEVLSAPLDTAVGPDGTVYVADTGHDRVLAFSDSGRARQSWGGSGSGPGLFAGPSGIAVSPDGRLYVSDTGNDRVQVFDPGGAFIHQWGGAGSAPGEFDRPIGIAIAPDRTVRVADEGNHRVQVFDPAGAFRHVLGWYGAGDGQFRSPMDLAVGSAGDTCVADPINAFAVRFDECGRALAGLGGTDDNHDWTPGRFRRAAGVAVGVDGSVYVSDRDRNRMQQFGPDGRWVRLWGDALDAGFGGEGRLLRSADLAVAPDGSVVLRDPYRLNRIQRLSAVGLYTGQWPLSGRLEKVMHAADAMAIGSDGTIYVLEDFNADKFVHTFTLDGTHLASWPLVVVGRPNDIAVGADGSVYVLSAAGADGERNRVQRYSADGRLMDEWGEWPRGQWPWLMAVGPLGDVYVTVDNHIERYTADGQLLGQWGWAGFGDGQFPPCDSCVSLSCLQVAPDGTVYASDFFTGRIQRFTREGTFLGVIRIWDDPQLHALNAAGLFALAPDNTLYALDANRGRLTVLRSPAPTTWHTAYHGDRWLSQRPLAIAEVDAVDFAWGTAPPAPYLPEDGFSLRLSRTFSLPAGDHEITVSARGGVRLWVDGDLLVDGWDGPTVDASVQVIVVEGAHRVVVEYNDPGGDAGLHVIVR